MDLPFLTGKKNSSPLDSDKLIWQLIKKLWYVCCKSLQSYDWSDAPQLEKECFYYSSWIPDIALSSGTRAVDSIPLPSNCLPRIFAEYANRRWLFSLSATCLFPCLSLCCSLLCSPLHECSHWMSWYITGQLATVLKRGKIKNKIKRQIRSICREHFATGLQQVTSYTVQLLSLYAVPGTMPATDPNSPQI